MIINVDEDIRLELIKETHSRPIFDMVNRNRNHLRTWLPFVDNMNTVDFAENFVKGTIERTKTSIEYAFVIFDGQDAVGRIGVYKIDPQNKVGEIGYWLIEQSQSKGIIIKSCRALIAYCFEDLQLNRIEIRCGTENFKSMKIPERLGFTKEGILRQAEALYGKFIDLYLFSILKAEYKRS